MANPAPGATPPNDPSTTDGPKPGSDVLARTPAPVKKTGSLSDTDWLSAIPDLPPMPDPKLGMPSLPDDELDLGAIFAEAAEIGPSSLTSMGADPSGSHLLTGETSEDVDLSGEGVAKVAPASGWYESGVHKIKPQIKPVPPIDSSNDDSDIFSIGRRKSRSGSDVLRVSDSGIGNSNIFDAPAEGSSRFHNPFDPTDDVREEIPGYQPPSPTGDVADDLFLAFDQPPSELFTDNDSRLVTDHFDDGSNAVNSLMEELHLPFPQPGSDPKYSSKPNGPITPGSSLDFSEVETGASSSNLFSELDAMDDRGQTMHSGVDLLNPDGNLPRTTPIVGQGSSIFQRPDLDNSKIDLDEIPLMGSSDEKTEAMQYTGEDVDGTSSIFQRGGGTGKNTSSVNFDMPKRTGKVVSVKPQSDSLHEELNDSGDWSLPNAKSDSSTPDLDALNDDIHSTARMEPSSGIFDVDMTQEPRGLLTGSSGSISKSGINLAAGISSRTLPATVTPSSSRIKPKTTKSARPSSFSKPSSKEAPARKGFGWIGGTALGLLVGVGGSTGAYLGGLIPTDGHAAVRTIVEKAPTGTPSAASDVTDARTFLALGEPDRALPALEAAGDGAPALVLAERGKARWLVRVRQMATSGKAIDPNDKYMKEAVANLEMVVSGADLLKTPEERRLVAEAALRIGLTKEMSGDTAGALAYYTQSAAKFPEAKALFLSAANRLKAMTASGKTAMLLPHQAEDLAQVAVFALVLMQADGEAGNLGADEPGTAFWDAINLATAGDYSGANKKLFTAKRLHNERRLKFAGRGMNPLTDPLEQIFLRTCDDLTAYYALKQQLYTHPVAGPVFAKSGIEAGLKELTASGKPDPKFAAELRNAKAELGNKISEMEIFKEMSSQRDKSLTKRLNECEQKLNSTSDDLKAAKQSQEVALKELAGAKKAFEDKAKEASEAQAKLLAAQKDVKTASDTVNSLVANLKASKFVGPDDDAVTILKQMPEVLKKIQLSAESGDAKKAAEALTKAKADLDNAMTAAKTADETAKKSQAEMKTAMMDAETKLATVKAESEKQLLTIKTESTKQIRAANAEVEVLKNSLTEERKKAADDAMKSVQKQIDDMKANYEDKIATLGNEIRRMSEEHRLQLANARAGVVVPLTSYELIGREQARGHFDRALDAYFNNRFTDAETSLNKATELDATDARYWYYLGLVRLAVGKSNAVDAFRKGAENEARNSPPTREINDALERIQGPARRTLASYRP